MPLPVWLKESYIDKKTMKNNQNKSFNMVTSRKFAEPDPLVSDLLGELQAIVVENTKLQNTNKTLKSMVSELQGKYDDLLASIQTNKCKFEEDLNKLHGEIKENETQLLENSKMCLQQQKRHIQEIHDLKVENEKLQSGIVKNETTFKEKIKNLEGEVKMLQYSNESMKSLNDENAQKSTKYKSKLKYAISIINDLNTMLLQYSSRPETNHQVTQTEDRQQYVLRVAPETPQLRARSLVESQSFTVSVPSSKPETDDLLLSEVFFKSKAFCDDIFLFNDNEFDLCSI